ncbi:glycosyl transferase family 2 [Dysgonomonas alginatilytica]|uniref:Glycosyl transferase family 2 n=1 Tax=Dysgonomonas alginatilytica TaxID=1605892 RepID=A0A2V3PP09_9BACT|nr:glycosyltransferase family 2 protein [Dysgonomonas alginatilytica]PXV63012.1 glycosyl transferase family 2 [Dysgonomonas alginatilytica]
MKSTINCFIPFENTNQVKETVASLQASDLVNEIFLFTDNNCNETIADCQTINIDSLRSTATIKKIAANANTAYTLIYTKAADLRLGYFALERMLQIAKDSGAGLIYADHYQVTDEEKKNSPLIAYQKGSLRDDFNFGSVLIYKSEELKKAVSKMDTDYKFAGIYDLRLKVSQEADLVHINEYLYTEAENDTRKSGEKIFDYVDPKNREVQVEMEKACTDHLKAVGGYLAPKFKDVEFNKAGFEYEASVIIPVRNRIRTIADAIKSVLNQKTNFKFNLIIVDNYSTDGTGEAIDNFASDERLIHIIPENKELGIGGCWNAGVHHPKCGKFSVQLDSDDVYSDENTLQKIVDAFYAQNCAMVVGSYMLTDFDMKMIPPGIIDHKEWTPENGRNNALRINGLGAPRAFYTPLLREIKVPNTSYGEDYALGLQFSREYQIGRIYDVLYLCRRWDDNSDASLDIVKMNAHNTYKDRIRTWELQARIALNKKSV